MRTLLFAPLALLLAACPQSSPTDAGDATPGDAMDGATDALDATTDVTPDVPADVPDAMPGWLEPYTPSPRAHVPDHFLWGSATAPYQIEGGLTSTTDWGYWDTHGHIAAGNHADDGPQSLTQWQLDVAALRETHQNAYRFGIEWARVFPTSAAWDACRTALAATPPNFDACHSAASATGLAYYHTLLAALRGDGTAAQPPITPLVTLQHFSLPVYEDDLSQDWHMQGWMRDDATAGDRSLANELAKWAAFAAHEFGGEVDWWVTINEPLVVATVGYLDGHSPPGQSFQLDAIVQVVNNMIRAHARMYDAIHASDTTVASAVGPVTPAPAAMVSIAHHVRKFYGANANDPRQAAAGDRGDYLFNRLFVEAIVNGNLDANLDGTLDDTERNHTELAHRADYLGINYYGLTVMDANSAIPLLHALPESDAIERGLPKTDYGWDIHPRGFQDELLWANGYGLPIVVTENGIADHADVNRPRYLVEHLAAMDAAIQRGARVIGYFHWSVVDNFEWSAGYCPHFGLYSVDMSSPARTRVARPSAMLYRSLIDSGEVTDDVLAMQPAYQTATTFCALGPTADGGM